ncbi:MAG: DUF503 domain-containing protein [Kiritimatiellae bacterium]|nr:DUF503 domain-containing protein [Kiritimatiellia bacterium]
MVVGLLTARLSIPEAHSLKDKRSALRSLKDRLVAHMNVSVAEVGDQDLWQSAEMAFVTVAATRDVVERRLADVRNFLASTPRWVLLDTETQLL